MTTPPDVYQACRKLFDSLTQGDFTMKAEKGVGLLNAFLGRDLIMSLMISPRGDILILQIGFKSVRVFADPSQWNGQEVEGASHAQVAGFLRKINARRRNRSLGGRHPRR